MMRRINMKKKIGFIGIGNMGGALLGACAKKVSGNEILVCDFSVEKVASAAEKYGCIPSSAEEIARDAEYIFICVKPQGARDTFASVQAELSARYDRFVLVSIMAGLEMATVQEMAGGEYPVIRIMPNVAASVGEAVLLCTSTENTPVSAVAGFKDFMSEAGRLDFIPESLIDAASAVSGCGPAYVCLFVEALADGAVRCGVPRAKAMEYAVQTLLGTAKLLMETGKHPAALKDEVTSPGGTTIAGIEALECGGFRHTVMDAVISAYERTIELK